MRGDAAESLTSDDAREVLLDVARSAAIVDAFPRVAQLCETPTLERLVDVAWRHQFADDRSVFKSQIRELQEYVANRATTEGVI